MRSFPPLRLNLSPLPTSLIVSLHIHPPVSVTHTYFLPQGLYLLLLSAWKSPLQPHSLLTEGSSLSCVSQLKYNFQRGFPESLTTSPPSLVSIT